MAKFQYSSTYVCNQNMYRHVIMRCQPCPKIIRSKTLMNAKEWKQLGIKQGKKWIHVGYSPCEEYYPVLLFKKKWENEELTDPLSPSAESA